MARYGMRASPPMYRREIARIHPDHTAGPHCMSSCSQRAVDGSSSASPRAVAHCSRFHLRMWRPSSSWSSREFVAIPTHRDAVLVARKATGFASRRGGQPNRCGIPTQTHPQPIPPRHPRPRRRPRRIRRVPDPPSCALCTGDAGRRGSGATFLLLGAGGASRAS